MCLLYDVIASMFETTNICMLDMCRFALTVFAYCMNVNGPGLCAKITKAQTKNLE